VAATRRIHILIGGADEFSIKKLRRSWRTKLAPKEGLGNSALEIIDGSASNQDEALKFLGRVVKR